MAKHYINDEFHDAFIFSTSNSKLMKNKSYESVRALADKKGILVHQVDEGRPCLKCGEKCPGFSLHFWRKVCIHCKCLRLDHDIECLEDIEQNVKKYYFPNSNLFFKSDNMNWIPSGLAKNLIDKYLSTLPYNKNPIQHLGRKYRQRQLLYQLPLQDANLIERSNDLFNQKEMLQVKEFVKLRKDRVSRATIQANSDCQNWKCSRCKLKLLIGDAAIMIEQAERFTYFHPHCFVCCQCKELLVDLIYFISNDELYCGRHHAETIKPRCAACDELIFTREYTRAEMLNWHLHHFCCIQCDALLGGKQYMLADNGHPYCLECFSNLFSKRCAACGNLICVDDARLSHSDYDWHGTADCFRCLKCKKSLIGSPFLPLGSSIFCSRECSKLFRVDVNI